MNKKSLAILIIAASCGSPSHSTVPAETDPMPSPLAKDLPAAPLGLELGAVAVRGELSVRLSDDGEWLPMTAGQSKAGVREVRASRRGAIVELGHGDAAGRIWMRAGSRVRIGQDERGVHVAVMDGEVRIRRATTALPVAIGTVPITGDYLLDAGDRGATMMTPTGARADLAAFSMALESADTGAGAGTMVAEPAKPSGPTGPGTGTPDAVEPVELAQLHVHVHVAGDVAITEVEHVFHSSATGRPREGTFRFPVPDGAMLTGMAMEVGGKLVEGEIVERDKAREVYDKVVDSMQDPALLEWEQGNWFKLRVFPITPEADKRVVIRYAAPLVHRPAGWSYDYALAIAGGRGGDVGEFSLDIDGKTVATQQHGNGLDVSVPIATDHVPVVMRETRTDATYTAVRITPDASMLTAPAAATGPARLAIVFDTSRSSLEGRKLADQQLGLIFDGLAPTDEVVVLASDVTVTRSTDGFVPSTTEARAAATKFLAAIEPDGASDLGAALTAAAALHPTEVIYIGDGTPTWGEQKPDALALLADAVKAPIHASLIGKGATTELWSELAGRTGGRAQVVARLDDAGRFALSATHAGSEPRLVDAHVVIAGDAAVFPQRAQTLYAGDELVALFRTPTGTKAPSSITLTGVSGGKPVSREITLVAATDEAGVARRWGAEKIATLEAAEADRDQIVAMSRDLGVLSRFTSLLVLENDEAYKQFQIERKQEQLAQAEAAHGASPQVTGGDLDSLGAQHASLSPGEVQPGDPEIKIPAPRDARSVLVTFSFGETKRAVWDDDVGAWMVRFLIDKDTPDGDYRARVTIEHADGRVELLSLPYTVDTHAPVVELTAKRTADGYAITATQRDRYKDADKVEVVLPDGHILALALDPKHHGVFAGTWTTSPVANLSLRVVVRDNALNESVQELAIP